MTIPWFRLSVDLDHDGNLRGCSYEVRTEDHLVKLFVLPEPGPFESASEVIDRLVEDVTDRYGVQLRLI